MRGVHILGGRREPAFAQLRACNRASFFRLSSLILTVASMLGTAACVGVTGKTATGGPAGGGDSPSATVTPSSVNFGNVTVGTTDSQTIRLANTGTADLTVTKISASGTGFSQSGLSMPLTLPAGHSTTFTASFKPTSSGTHTGGIAITSNAGGSALSIQLTGNGATTNAKLSANQMGLNFGVVTVGRIDSQNVLLTNTGNTNVAISSVSTAGAGFTSTGGVNATLTPNQSVTVSISFDPRAPGGVTGTLTILSNAPTVQIALAGQGAAAGAAHSVSLDWTPSITRGVGGYNVYRGNVSGGPYARLNPTVETLTSFTDHGVVSGKTYYYVVTAVDVIGFESAFSSQASVTIPSP